MLYKSSLISSEAQFTLFHMVDQVNLKSRRVSNTLAEKRKGTTVEILMTFLPLTVWK